MSSKLSLKNLTYLVQKNTGWLKLMAINLGLLAVFIEVATLGFYFYQRGQFFYTRNKVADDLEQRKSLPKLDQMGRTDRIATTERLHPFFGYVQIPGPDFRVGFKYNNLGFISPYDYPFVKTKPNQFIIGVFGGSVASNYSIYEIQNGILEKKLKELPEFKDKEIIILSFAIGGFKQPQQVLLLNYFLSIGQKLDMVINLDGFNEVAIGSLNNQAKFEFSMPSMQQVQPLADLANYNLSTKALQAMLNVKQTEMQIKDEIDTLDNCYLASCYVFNSLQLQELVKNYAQGIKRFERERKRSNRLNNQGSLFYFYRQENPLENADLYDRIAENWVKSSVSMQQLLAANNIPYFHILQPNQYYPTAKTFSEAEKKVAFDPDTEYEDGVKNGYPVLLEKIPDLQKQNIKFFSALNVFDRTSEAAYIDSCCHYTPIGEKILSEYIAEAIFTNID